MARALIKAGVLLLVARGPCLASEVLHVDFADYDPISLVVRQQHLIEDQVGPSVQVQWLQSAGSNKALDYLRAGVLDIGSTAGSAALLGRANGVPIKVVAVYGRPEWVALVTRGGSGIHTVADLRGKRVAATPGTDAGIFLLRALQTAHLSMSDVTLIPLQHKDGRAALDRGDVDAWSGLDPFMAMAEAQNHDVIFYRNAALVTPGTLVVREQYAAEHPERVSQVIVAYERARQWAVTHHDAFLALIEDEAKLPADAANLQLERSRFDGLGVTGPDRTSIAAAAEILRTSGAASAGADLQAADAALIDTQFVDPVASR